ERDGLLRATFGCLTNPIMEFGRRILLKNVEEVVVTNLEDFGSNRHTDGIALAQVEIDDDSHDRLLSATGSRSHPTADVTLTRRIRPTRPSSPLSALPEPRARVMTPSGA